MVCGVLGHSGFLAMLHSIEHIFLIDFNRNSASVLYRFRVIASYLSSRSFQPIPLAFGTSIKGDLVEFCGDFWHQKTRVPVLSCGIACVILC